MKKVGANYLRPNEQGPVTGEPLNCEQVKNLRKISANNHRHERAAITHFTHSAQRCVKNHRDQSQPVSHKKLHRLQSVLFPEDSFSRRITD